MPRGYWNANSARNEKEIMRSVGDEIIFNPHADDEVRSRILSNSGFSVIDRVYFESMSKIPITKEMAMEHQDRLGYHHVAYDFAGFTCEIDAYSKKYIATWYCWASTGD